MDIDLSASCCDQVHWEVHKALVPQRDDHASLASQGGMNRVSGQLVAENPVLGRRNDAAQLITRVDIFDVNVHGTRPKLIPDAVSEENADVAITPVSGGIRLCRAGWQKLLSGSFRNHNKSVSTLVQPAFQTGQQTRLSLQLERDFGNEHKIRLRRGEGCRTRDESGIAPHQFHKANAISRAPRLRMRRFERPNRLGKGAQVPETAVHIEEIVVYGFRDPYHSDP